MGKITRMYATDRILAGHVVVNAKGQIFAFDRNFTLIGEAASVKAARGAVFFLSIHSTSQLMAPDRLKRNEGCRLPLGAAWFPPAVTGPHGGGTAVSRSRRTEAQPARCKALCSWGGIEHSRNAAGKISVICWRSLEDVPDVNVFFVEQLA